MKCSIVLVLKRAYCLALDSTVSGGKHETYQKHHLVLLLNFIFWVTSLVHGLCPRVISALLGKMLSSSSAVVSGLTLWP